MIFNQMACLQIKIKIWQKEIPLHIKVIVQRLEYNSAAEPLLTCMRPLDFIQHNAKRCVVAPACVPCTWTMEAEHQEFKDSSDYIEFLRQVGVHEASHQKTKTKR